MSISSAQPAAVRRAGAFGVHSLYRFAFTVPDLDEAERFYWAFGLSPRRIGDRLDLYTHGHPHCWASIHQNGAQKKLQYVSYAVYEDDFDAFRSRIDRLGLQCEPHPLCDEEGLWLRDPDGVPTQILVAPKLSPATKLQPAVAVAPCTRAVPSRSAAPPVRPRRLMHILQYTPNVPRMTQFCTEVLGLRLSDTMHDAVAFLHGVHGSDHHLVAFGGSHAPGLHHSAWEVSSVDEVGFGAEQMRARGYTSGWGIGRHITGSNYFHYVRDPWGSYAEYAFDLDFVAADVDWEPADLSPEDGFYAWGPPPPKEFLINQEVTTASPAGTVHRGNGAGLTQAENHAVPAGQLGPVKEDVSLSEDRS